MGIDIELIKKLDIQDCPFCGGPAILEEENDRWFYIVCGDCGSVTCEIEYKTPEEREQAAEAAAHLWNIGKVNKTGVGE